MQIIKTAVNIPLSDTRIIDSGHKFPFKGKEMKGMFNTWSKRWI